MNKIPNVFISYSHDSIEHKLWILELATRMRKNGIDAKIDQWELKPGDDLPHFMEKHLREADKILMICSENYVTKANNGQGGVGYEKMIVTASLLKNIDENKVIPIIRQQATSLLPTFLTTKLYLDFSKESDFEFSFDELVRTIHGSPLYEKPEIGNNPFKQTINKIPSKQNDALLEVMKIVVNGFNNTSNHYVLYKHLIASFNGSRIMLDILLDEAESLKLIARDKDKDIVLTAEGKKYALNKNLA